MNSVSVTRRALFAIGLVMAAGHLAAARQTAKPFEPTVGQAGKDVIWVPTPAALVDKMMDLAAVTADDYVIDLGSGDGRNVIAAAKRGAQALGVEFNPDMVTLSTQNAQAAGVANKARFVRGDMFKADISRASVMALFLLPSNMLQLRSKFFLTLKPGSRIVSNTFTIDGWYPDKTENILDCTEWCTAHLWIVPAKVDGTWRLSSGRLILKQDFQLVSGTLDGGPIANGRLHGETLTFTAGDATYAGRVDGKRIEGTMTTGGSETRWTARR